MKRINVKSQTDRKQNANPDAVLTGRGVMFANLQATLKLLEPQFFIQLHEVTEDLALSPRIWYWEVPMAGTIRERAMLVFVSLARLLRM